MKIFKILYIVSTLQRVGPTNQLFNIVKYMDRTTFEPIIVTLSPEERESREKDFIGIGVPIVSLNLSRLRGFFHGPSRLRQFVSAHNPDIIHTNGFRSDTISAKHLSGYARLSTLRGNLLDNYSDTYGRMLGHLLSYQQVRALKKMDGVIACSKTIAHQVAHQYLHIHTIHNAIDNDIYHTVSVDERLKLREKLNLSPNKKIYISVGSLSARKDPVTLIRGFLLNSQSAGDRILLFLGSGPLDKACRNLSKKHPNVVMRGMVSNVHEYLKASDFFMSASLSEGLPNSVIEALACGLPVCLSDIPQHKEIINFDTNAGAVFSTKNIHDLSIKLNLLSERDYKPMRFSAVNLVERYFDGKKMSESYQKIYLELLNK